MHFDEDKMNQKLFFPIFVSLVPGTWTIQSLVQGIESILTISCLNNFFCTLQILHKSLCYEPAVVELRHIEKKAFKLQLFFTRGIFRSS
jgi:hypothetical protein